MDYRALLIVPMSALVLSVSAAAPRVPDHWNSMAIAHTSYPAQGAGYDIGIDAASATTGTPALTIRSTGHQLPVPASVGALTQPAFGYGGQRIRFNAEVRAEGPTAWAGGFLTLADGGQLTRVARGEPDAERQLPVGRSASSGGGWQQVSVVIDVPADVPMVSVGLALVGEGQMWARKLSFEAVGRDVPLTTTPIGIDWAAAREALSQGRRVMAKLPPQPLINVGLD